MKDYDYDKNDPEAKASDRDTAWGKFRAGNGLSDYELDLLLEDLERGIEFLENRKETGGVLFKARLDRETIRAYKYQRART